GVIVHVLARYEVWNPAGNIYLLGASFFESDSVFLTNCSRRALLRTITIADHHRNRIALALVIAEHGTHPGILFLSPSMPALHIGFFGILMSLSRASLLLPLFLIWMVTLRNQFVRDFNRASVFRDDDLAPPSINSEACRHDDLVSLRPRLHVKPAGNSISADQPVEQPALGVEVVCLKLEMICVQQLAVEVTVAHGRPHISMLRC